MNAWLRCPICGRQVKFGAPLMPFCSARCREIDLGEWAREKYVISTPAESTGPTDPDGESE